MFGFRKWKEYVEMVLRAKRVMKTWTFTYVPLCFAGWKSILTAKHAHIAEMHRIAEHRAKYGGLFVRYKRWVIYTTKERRKKGKPPSCLPFISMLSHLHAHIYTLESHPFIFVLFRVVISLL